MALCLKRLKNIQKVKLVDASFVWTEPHSKRIKVDIKDSKLSGASQYRRYFLSHLIEPNKFPYKDFVCIYDEQIDFAFWINI